MPDAAPPPPDPVRLGRALCGQLDEALRREWLATDGSGAYACGTVAFGLARRYHGLLVAATQPPLGRMLAVAGLSETVLGAGPDGAPLGLHTQEWASGAVEPRGHVLLESFELDGGVPTWRYALPGALLVRRVWMQPGAQVACVGYALERAVPGFAVQLAVRPLCTWRDHHVLGFAGAAPRVDALADGVRVQFDGAPAYAVRMSGARVDVVGDWYRSFRLRVETERGLDDVQDLYAAGTLGVVLGVDAPAVLTVALGDDGADPSAGGAAWRSLDAVHQREREVVARSVVRRPPPWIRRLLLAADQFLADRAGMATVLAGFPWFGDWGRDTMISLPGLALATGRPEVAAGLLRGFARYVADGLLPNRFPDHGETPEYNTADATLWYVEALRAYHAQTGDDALVHELWPVLDGILSAHVAGTRHGIGMDARDGLLSAGEAGRQLTWMDALVDGWVVTPRMGKPVEINALWHNALCCLASWSTGLGLRLQHDPAELVERVAVGFDRYWNAETQYLHDVLDGPDGDDPSVRPNAVIAASLAHSPVSPEHCRTVVVRAQRDLVTSLGLRSLAPESTRYVGVYTGDLRARDAGYHQGTVWPWLIGPFVAAHLRAFGDRVAARAFLLPLADHLSDAGLGSISEIADGDAPHTPHGCPWQAWSVAEVLRAWWLTEG